MGVRTICVEALFDLDAFVLSRPWLVRTLAVSCQQPSSTVRSDVVENVVSQDGSLNNLC